MITSCNQQPEANNRMTKLREKKRARDIAEEKEEVIPEKPEIMFE